MNKKLNNLQALRAFAALNVVLFHLIGTSASYGFGVDHLKIFEGWGFNGVDIFFVLSGFIMVYIQKDKTISPATFFIDRLTRIAPLYWLLTGTVLALTFIFPSIFRSDVSNIQIHSLASIFFMSQPLLEKMPVLYDGWTLEYEMLFYLSIAIGLFFRKKILTYPFVMLVISFLIIFNLIQTVAFEFLLGIFLGNLYLNIDNNKKIQLASLVIGLTWFFSTLIVFRWDGEIYTQRIIMYGLPSFLIIYGLLGIKQIHSGILTKLGDASYSIYLIQVFTIPAFYKIIKVIKLFDGVSHDFLAIICLISTAIGGYVLYELVEEANNIGWKTIREVRLEIYKQALQEAEAGVGDGMEKLLHQSEVKAARVFLDAYFNAKEGTSKCSAGNIALRRNGFSRIDGQSYSNGDKRSREMNAWEDSMRERMEDDLSAEEKEQLELSRE